MVQRMEEFISLANAYERMRNERVQNLRDGGPYMKRLERKKHSTSGGLMEEIGIPELTTEQLEELCETAEKAAREYILSKIPPRRISVLNITIDTEGSKPITVNVDVEVTLSLLMKNYDVKKLASEATKKAFVSIEMYLRKLECKSTR